MAELDAVVKCLWRELHDNDTSTTFQQVYIDSKPDPKHPLYRCCKCDGYRIYCDGYRTLRPKP